MSFYFTILSPNDLPLFTYTFGTSKSSGDGNPRFPAHLLKQCPFIANASLDLLEEAQWSSGAMYLKQIDKYQGVFVSGFVTGGNVRFLLLSTNEVDSQDGAGGKGVKAFVGEFFSTLFYLLESYLMELCANSV
jgi:trafficking protein particle complex subunit 2